MSKPVFNPSQRAAYHRYIREHTERLEAIVSTAGGKSYKTSHGSRGGCCEDDLEAWRDTIEDDRRRGGRALKATATRKPHHG